MNKCMYVCINLLAHTYKIHTHTGIYDFDIGEIYGHMENGCRNRENEGFQLRNGDVMCN